MRNITQGSCAKNFEKCTVRDEPDLLVDLYKIRYSTVI